MSDPSDHRASLSPIKERLLAALGRSTRGEAQQPRDGVVSETVLGWQQTLCEIIAEVLRLPAVSGSDNYFRLGGDSISSILITAKARKQGIPITTRMLLEAPSVGALVHALRDANEAKLPTARAAASTSGAMYSLTPMQHGILHDCLRNPDGKLYVSHLVLRIDGELDLELLSLAWNHVFRSNDVLHNRWLAGPAGVPMQAPDPEARCDLIQAECASGDDRCASALADLNERLEGSIQRLDRAPLCAIGALRGSRERCWLIFIHHHLILDGWSQQLVLQELFATYDAFRRGQEPDETRRPPFREFVEATASIAHDRSFWQSYLKGAWGVPRLTSDIGNRATTCTAIAIPEAAAEGLRRFNAECAVSFATLLQGLWILVLGVASGSLDIVYGLTMSGRDVTGETPHDFCDVVGMCINTLPVRMSISPDMLFADWLRHVQSGIGLVQRHQHSALAQIARDSGSSRAPMFDSLVVIENLPVPPQGLGGLRVDVEHFEINEGLPIVFVVFLGAAPRLELRLQAGRCGEGMGTRLARLLSGAVPTALTATRITRVGTVLEGLRATSDADSTTTLLSSRRTPV